MDLKCTKFDVVTDVLVDLHEFVDELHEFLPVNEHNGLELKVDLRVYKVTCGLHVRYLLFLDILIAKVDSDF